MKIQPRSFAPCPEGITLRDLDAGDKGRLTVRADGESHPVIGVYDTIDEGFGGRMSQALRQVGARPVLVEINSKGGLLFEGLAAMNALLQHPAPIRARITGLAASAASLLAMGAGQIEVVKSGTIMVHNAQGLVAGDHRMFAEASKVFEGFSATVRAVYAERTGQSEQTIAKLMDDATWMNAERAKTLGFADTIVEAAASPTAVKKRDLRAALKAQGLTRSQVSRAISHIFGHDDEEEDEGPDLDRIAAALNSSFAAVEPYL